MQIVFQFLKKSNINFFNNLREVSQIFVMGHSLNPIDLAYYKKIASIINIEHVRWKVSFYCDAERDNFLNILKKELNINEKLITLDKLSREFIYIRLT